MDHSALVMSKTFGYPMGFYLGHLNNYVIFLSGFPRTREAWYRGYNSHLDNDELDLSSVSENRRFTDANEMTKYIKTNCGVSDIDAIENLRNTWKTKNNVQ